MYNQCKDIRHLDFNYHLFCYSVFHISGFNAYPQLIVIKNFCDMPGLLRFPSAHYQSI